jgi:hypothetical protein
VFDSLVTPSLFGLVIVVGAQNEKRLRALLVTVVLVATALSAVMIHQSQSDFQCVLLRKGEDGAIDFSNGKGDGRRCETSVECEKQPIERGAVYDCERVGMFDSFTTARGRVRWRGVLSDPNEVCLLLAISLMFAYGTLESKKQRYRLVTFLMLTALFGGVVVLTQSRSGLLVMLAVLAMVFVRRFGSRGLLVAATVGLPIFLFGGRSGAEADESTAERTQLLYAGLDMVKQFPVLGVGVGQYREHAWPPLTAHNSYLLPAAELGLLGQLAFGVVLFTAVKIPWRLGWRTHPGVSPEIVSLAVGVTFAYAGLLLGIVFLSMCYHPLLYVMFGISGALHGTAMRQMPGYRFRLTFGEIGLVFLMGLGSLLVTYTYVKLRLTS